MACLLADRPHRGPVEREASRTLAGQLPAGVVLGDEFHVAVVEAALGCLEFDPEIRELQVAADNRQSGRGGESLHLLGAIHVRIPV